MGQNMKENGTKTKIPEMVKECRFGPMVLYMKVIGRMIKLMVEDA